MPIPVSIDDLSTVAADNSPQPGDTPIILDDVMRAMQAIVRKEYDDQQAINADIATGASITAHTSQTAGAHGMSAFGASLVDDASAAAARSTLGLGSAAQRPAPAGAIVGDTDSQTITNKVIAASANTITTAATSGLTATELNAALAQLRSQIAALESSLSGVGAVTVHYGYIDTTSVQAGTGRDASFVDINIASLGITDFTKCEVFFVGGASNANSTFAILDNLDSTVTASYKVWGRLTSNSNLRLSNAAPGMVRFMGQYQITVHGG